MGNDRKNLLLYHYCSNETMEKIIRSKTLRMTDISRSNDINELKIFHPYVFRAIEQSYRAEPFPFLYRGKKDYDAIQELIYETRFKLERSYQEGVFTSFVVCFCEEGDTLSQWRGYANNAKGCSIGFSKNELENYCNNQGNVITIQKVQYINTQKVETITNKFAQGLMPIMRVLRSGAEKCYAKDSNPKEEDIEDFMGFIILDLVKRFLIDSLKYKIENYKEEKEWRMYFTGITKDRDDLFADIATNDYVEVQMRHNQTVKILHNNVDFYTKEDCIISYYPINLLDISENPIKQMYIGPKNNSYAQDFILLFAKEGLGNPIVNKSGIAYR